ncbi:MAG: DUF917 domain-containing protein [Candidatus Hodarchaeales archaeon]|jgi:DUF917 family protein
MPRKLTINDTQNLVEGAKILGTGGGGDSDQARKRIQESYSAGKYFKIQELSEFLPTDMVCIIGMVGGGVSVEDKKFIRNLPVSSSNVLVDAVEELETYLGYQFTGFISTEMGPGNIVVPLWVGAHLKRVAVDGDMCGGRSKPMISISTTNVAGISITPLAVVSNFADRLILKEAISDKRAEDICRALARISNGTIGVARCPMTALECQKAIVPGTISLAIQLGQEITEANSKKISPLPTIERVLDAQLVFTGTVDHFSRSEKGGFTSGEIGLRSKNHTLKIWYKNEYLLSWLDGKQYISCPDSLLVVDFLTGKGLTPWEDEFQEDREIAVLVRPSASIWKTRKGLEVFGPQVFQPRWTYQSNKIQFR